MFTVRVAAKVHVGREAAFLDALAGKPDEVRDRFPECRWYGVYVDSEDPLRVLVYEEWSSQGERNVVDAHSTTTAKTLAIAKSAPPVSPACNQPLSASMPGLATRTSSQLRD